MAQPKTKKESSIIVRDAFHLYESRTYHARPDVEPLRAGRPGRAQVPDPKSRVSDQPSAPTTWYDGHSKTWRMMAHSTQERLCYRGTHGWKQPLWFVLISGRNNKKKSRLVGEPSDRRLSSLVRRALVGLKIFFKLNVTA
jgi:hypothetical protein